MVVDWINQANRLQEIKHKFKIPEEKSVKSICDFINECKSEIFSEIETLHSNIIFFIVNQWRFASLDDRQLIYKHAENVGIGKYEYKEIIPLNPEIDNQRQKTLTSIGNSKNRRAYK